MNEVKLTEFKGLCEDLWQFRKVVDEKKAELKEMNSELEAKKSRILSFMDDAELDNFQSDSCTVYRSIKESVKFPKDPEEKKKVFEYIADKYGDDALGGLVTINSTTFNSWYKEETKKAMDEGQLSPEVPGVGEPSLFTTLGVRKR